MSSSLVVLETLTSPPIQRRPCVQAEIDADVILKATKVDGVYDRDPAVHDDATRFDSVSYMEVLQRGLKVMDNTAVSLCMDNEIPIVVFNLNDEGNIRRVLQEKRSGQGYTLPRIEQTRQRGYGSTPQLPGGMLK